MAISARPAGGWRHRHLPSASLTARGPRVHSPGSPSFDIVPIEPRGQAVIAGRALPGDRVRVLDGDTPLGEVTADAHGEWVLVPDKPIAPGNRQLGIEAIAPRRPRPALARYRRAVDITPRGDRRRAGFRRWPCCCPARAGHAGADTCNTPRHRPQPPPTLSLDTAEYGGEGPSSCCPAMPSPGRGSISMPAASCSAAPRRGRCREMDAAVGPVGGRSAGSNCAWTSSPPTGSIAQPRRRAVQSARR